MEFIFHNSFNRSCRLNSALSQRYRIPNSRERVKSGPRPKKHEDTFKMVLPFDCMDIHMFNKVKRQ